MNSVHLDQLIYVGDPVSNVWYDYSLSPVEVHDDCALYDISSSKTPRSRRGHRKAPLKERKYICEECASSFTNSANLNAHLRLHSGERPFVCDICNIAFAQNSNLTAHKRIHSGERPFVCSECGRGFLRSSHLASHKRTHTGELPFACNLCLKQFGTSSQLKLHKSKHRDGEAFLCNVCDHNFTSVESLTLHSRLHSGRKPYRCIICMASFRSRGDLYMHKKLHPGISETNYICDKCGNEFKLKICYEKHIEKCHVVSICDRMKGDMEIIGTDYYLDPLFISEDCLKVELLEKCIEEGIEEEADEHTVVFSCAESSSNT